MGSRVSMAGAAAQRRRTEIRDEFWPKATAWLGSAEVGYFCAPRTLSLVLRVLREKKVSGDKDPSGVYLELLANHMGEGVVEITVEDDHAYASGYSSTRSWLARMKTLEEAGFIKTAPTGNRRCGRVLLIHPSVAVSRLYKAGKISEDLWKTYRARQITMKEPSADEVLTR